MQTVRHSVVVGYVLRLDTVKQMVEVIFIVQRIVIVFGFFFGLAGAG